MLSQRFTQFRKLLGSFLSSIQQLFPTHPKPCCALPPYNYRRARMPSEIIIITGKKGICQEGCCNNIIYRAAWLCNLLNRYLEVRPHWAQCVYFQASVHELCGLTEAIYKARGSFNDQVLHKQGTGNNTEPMDGSYSLKLQLHGVGMIMLPGYISQNDAGNHHQITWAIMAKLCHNGKNPLNMMPFVGLYITSQGLGK